MRLVRAEMLKLARRRGTMIWAALLTVGSVVVTESILVILHAANADKHGPAGGLVNFDHVVSVIAGLGMIAAIIVGSTAGSQDVSAGVFRDLVITGTPRSSLFRARLPGALGVFLPLVAVSFLVAVLCAYVFAGSSATPGAGDLGRYAAYLLATIVVNMAIAIGLTAFVSSRVAVGVLIAWNAIVGPLLLNIKALGGARKGIDVAAAQALLPAASDNTPQVTMATGTALFVLVAWLAVWLLAGRLGTQRRDA